MNKKKIKLVLSGMVMYLSGCFVWSTCHISFDEALRSGDPKTVENALLEEGVEGINAKDAEGMTPLHFAVDNNNVNVAEVLLNYGAKIDTHGWNPWSSSLCIR